MNKRSIYIQKLPIYYANISVFSSSNLIYQYMTKINHTSFKRGENFECMGFFNFKLNSKIKKTTPISSESNVSRLILCSLTKNPQSPIFPQSPPQSPPQKAQSPLSPLCRGLKPIVPKTTSTRSPSLAHPHPQCGCGSHTLSHLPPHSQTHISV